MISGRPLQIQSGSGVSRRLEILGGKRDMHATLHHFIKDVQVGGEGDSELISVEPLKREANINS